jgi:phage-related tail protein
VTDYDKKGAAGDEYGATPDAGRDRAKEWLTQLQAMIDNLATHAAPVAREIGAKAAELAALAGEKAGPIAHKAAEVTAAAGGKVAERGREVAADLRRDPAATTNGQGAGTAKSGTAVAAPDPTEDKPLG